ncbi:hypothetical protein G6F56_005973 [Rhizopus delemar]|nr:hypothetical protein G6F56_005973 [Rhizopus delemar]
MDEFDEKINGRHKTTEDLLKDVAEIENRINQVQESVYRKRQRIDEHRESEKRYRQTNEDMKKKLTKLKQINGGKYQQSPKDTLQSLDFACKQIEKLIEQQCTLGKQVASVELARIQPSIEKLLSSSIVDCPKQLNQNLDHYFEKVKKENKVQLTMSDVQEVIEKVQTGIKRECSERVSEGRRLLQTKDRLEHETKETELKLAKRVKEMYDDATIQSAFK